MKYPPLRYTVPGVILLLGLCLSGGTLWYERKVAVNQVEALVQRQLNFIGNQISGVATYFIAQNDLEGLRNQVSGLGADPVLRYATVCDDELRVLASSSFDQSGKLLGQTPLAYAREKVQRSRRAITEISADRKTVLGVFPFLLPPSGKELISSRHGCLLLEYDMSHPKKQVARIMMERWSYATSFLGLVCIVTWGFFHRVVNLRIARLVAATEKLARGESRVSAGLSGHDELARLSKAFDAMAEKLSVHNGELKQANLRMKQEITERQFIEEALRNSERRFRSIWENSLDAMRLTDEKGTILAVNPAYCRLMEMPMEELAQRPFTVAHDPLVAERSLQLYRQAFAERSIEPQQYKRVKLMSGKQKDIDASYSFIEMDRPLLLAIFRDVSERVAALLNVQEAKEFADNLIKTANVMIVGLDAARCITIFNEAAEKVSGYKKSELEGRSWENMVIFEPAMNNPEAKNGDSAHLSRTFEARIKTKAGEERLISWQTNSIYSNGSYGGTICFGIDITDKRKQEEQRLALERKLLDSQKLESLGVLAGGIAHDFNNLLTAILGNAALASNHAPPESKLKNHLLNIEKTSLRAAELCKQMLAYAGKGRFAMQYLDVNEVVNETVELLEVSISKKAGLKIELRPELPGVLADPSQIRQVLMNLVINASEAMAEKSGLIRIRTGTIQAGKEFFENACMAGDLAPGKYVYVEVSDNGCGMSNETMARIFDPFFTTKFTGRGLGLAAVLGIVRGHNGALKIQSESGKGSSFKFVLPIVNAAPVKPVNSTTNVHVDWKGEGTVLVVDDDPTVRAVTARMVEACGFKVLQAVDGKHGVEVFNQNHKAIRAVVLDMTMPNLNGHEAFEEMRRVDPDVNVLLMSGFSQTSRQAQSAPTGVRGFLQKPFRPEDLKGKLREIFLM